MIVKILILFYSSFYYIFAFNEDDKKRIHSIEVYQYNSISNFHILLESGLKKIIDLYSVIFNLQEDMLVTKKYIELLYKEIILLKIKEIFPDHQWISCVIIYDENNIVFEVQSPILKYIIKRMYDDDEIKILEKLKTASEKEKLAFKSHPDHESNDEIASRMLNFLREIAVTYAGKNVLVVSHGSIIRAFLMSIGFATYDQLRPEHIENTAYVKLESDGVDFFIKETKGINKITV